MSATSPWSVRPTSRPSPCSPDKSLYLNKSLYLKILISQQGSRSLSFAAYTEVWQDARLLAFTPVQVASPLAKRLYDLRHAAVFRLLNAGVSAPGVAERAGHGVAVLLRVYAKYIDGQQEIADKGIVDALAA